jgi:flagellar M-ring protein FliF
VFQPASDSDGLVRSVQELTEYFRGGAAGDGGAAGTQSNVPLYQAQAASGGTSSESEKTETVKNYELNETLEHTVIAPGALKRLSVSVVVNQELATADAQQIERLVSAAVGSDPMRNDQIVVTGMPFNTDLAQAVAADVMAAKRRQLIYTGGGAGLALVAGLVIFLRARRSARDRIQEQVVIAEEVVPELPPADMSRLKSQEELQRLFRQRPEAAAQLIRSWLVEE